MRMQQAVLAVYLLSLLAARSFAADVDGSATAVRAGHDAGADGTLQPLEIPVNDNEVDDLTPSERSNPLFQHRAELEKKMDPEKFKAYQEAFGNFDLSPAQFGADEIARLSSTQRIGYRERGSVTPTRMMYPRYKRGSSMYDDAVAAKLSPAARMGVLKQWLSVLKAANAVDKLSDDKYYGTFSLSDDKVRAEVSFSEMEENFFKSMKMMTGHDPPLWTPPVQCDATKPLNQYQGYSLERISDLQKKLEEDLEATQQRLVSSIGVTFVNEWTSEKGSTFKSYTSKLKFFTFEMAVNVIERAFSFDRSALRQVMVASQCLESDDVDSDGPLYDKVRKKLETCKGGFVFMLAAEAIVRPSRNAETMVVRAICSFVDNMNLDQCDSLSIKTALQTAGVGQWAVNALAVFALPTGDTPHSTPMAPEDAIAYEETWKTYEPLIPSQLAEAMKSINPDAFKGTPEKPRYEGRVLTAEQIESICQLPPGDYQFRQLCTDPRTMQLSWDWCRDVMFLREGWIPRDCMLKLVQHRDNVVMELLDAAVAYTHQELTHDVQNAAHTTESDDSVTSGGLPSDISDLFLSRGDMESKSLQGVVSSLFEEKMDKELFEEMLRNVETFLAEYEDQVAKQITSKPPPRLSIPRIECKSPGSTDPDSDIDMPASGPYGEDIVQIFYYLFSKRYGCIESSTSMDVNIYAVDGDMYIKINQNRIGGAKRGSIAWNIFRIKLMQVDVLAPFVAEQDVASLVSIRRVMDESSWELFKRQVLTGLEAHARTPDDVKFSGISNRPGGLNYIRHTIQATQERFTAAESLYEDLEGELNAEICKLSGEKHCSQDVVEMVAHRNPDLPNKAMNRIYERLLSAFKAKRLQFDLMVERTVTGRSTTKGKVAIGTSEAIGKIFELDTMFKDMASEYVNIGYYAAEAYLSGGALTHVVGNLQAKRNFPLMPEQVLQSLNEQFGMLLHGFKHIFESEQEGLKLGKALFKTGKYLDRMASAFDSIVQVVCADSDNIPRTTVDPAMLADLGNKLVKVKKTQYSMDVLRRRGMRSQVLLREFMDSVLAKTPTLKCEVIGYMYGSSSEITNQCERGDLNNGEFRESLTSDVFAINPELALRNAFLGLLSKFVSEVNVIARVRGVSASLIQFESKEDYLSVYQTHYMRMREQYEKESKRLGKPIRGAFSATSIMKENNERLRAFFMKGHLKSKEETTLLPSGEAEYDSTLYSSKSRKGGRTASLEAEYDDTSDDTLYASKSRKSRSLGGNNEAPV